MPVQVSARQRYRQGVDTEIKGPHSYDHTPNGLSREHHGLHDAVKDGIGLSLLVRLCLDYRLEAVL